MRRRGKRGAGSITERWVGPKGHKRKVYQARVSTTEGGKRVRKAKSFDFRDDAAWWLREASRGGAPDRLTVAAYLERWLAGKRDLRESTRLQYENHVRVHIVPELGGFELTELTRAHVERFVNGRSRYVSESTHRKLSASTVRAILVTLRSALEEGVPRELPDNPARRVRAPRVQREPVRAVGTVEAKRILAAVRGTWVEPIARFLFGSGLRIGEALSIDQGMIDWPNGKVRIGKSKTGIRRLSVTADAMDALRLALVDAPRLGPKEPVFFGPKPSRSGQRDRLSRHSVAHALPRLLAGASIEHLTPHGLRHAHATTRLELGHDIETIAAQLGHKNPTMTRNVYAHVTERSQRATLAELDEAVKG